MLVICMSYYAKIVHELYMNTANPQVLRSVMYIIYCDNVIYPLQFNVKFISLGNSSSEHAISINVCKLNYLFEIFKIKYVYIS